jgi:hypothetical protein|tara:strand:- start:5627 stop:7699 length:2073 start_codon:yes stop_codon:yes gene_type:complete
MANSDKDILITPGKNTGNLPNISFVGQGNVPVALNVLDSNTLSFESTAGELFSITNNLSSGYIFSVNDVSGVPSIAVNANGRIDIARYNGNVNIGSNSNATDKTLCVTGNMALTTKDSNPAEIHFYDGGLNTGNGVLRLGFDGPSQTGSSEYLFIKDASGTAHWTMTQQGAIGIRNTSPRTRLHLIGEHTTTQFRMTLPSANNGGGTGEINMQMWVSEGNRTWDAGGIGMNVSNYNTQSYPSNSPNSDNSWFPRLNSNIGQAYIRFFPNGGRIEFSTRDNNGTSYREQIHMRYGCIGVNRAPQNSTDKVYVYNGDINIEGGKYKINGQEFNSLPDQTDTTRGSYLVSDGGNGAFWAYPGATNPSSPLTGYRYRSLFTHGYIGGGYKGSQPWRSLNKTWHTTDTTFYCGEQLDRAAAYCDGTWSDYNAYVHGTVNSYSGNSSHTSSYNLNTGIKRVTGDSRFSQYSYGYQGDNPRTVMGYNVTGGWAMNVGRNDAGCASNQIGQAGYITGGGSSVTNKLHFPTEIMYTTNSSVSGSDFVAGFGGETRAYFSWRDGNQQRMTYSNDSFANQNFAGNNRGWCKALGTKWGHFYIGTSNNVTTPVRKVRDSDGAALSNFNRARAAGEENMQMGQDWGYKLGDFDGQQNNHTEKWTYSNDSIATMGFATRPKGHYGQSSAACSSAAASVTTTQPF